MTEKTAAPKKVAPTLGRVVVIRNTSKKEQIIYASEKNKIKLAAGAEHPIEVTPWLVSNLAAGIPLEIVKQSGSRKDSASRLYEEFHPEPEEEDEDE